MIGPEESVALPVILATESRERMPLTLVMTGGRMTGEQYGTTQSIPLYHTMQYNIRGQLSYVSLGRNGGADRGYIAIYYSSNASGYNGGTDNNGNVLRNETGIPHDEVISGWDVTRDDYAYDSLNRISSVNEYAASIGTSSVGAKSRQMQHPEITPIFPPIPSVTQQFVYDQYGNRISTGTWTVTSTKQFIVDASTNRLYAPVDPNHTKMNYDAAGGLYLLPRGKVVTEVETTLCPKRTKP